MYSLNSKPLAFISSRPPLNSVTRDVNPSTSNTIAVVPPKSDRNTNRDLRMKLSTLSYANPAPCFKKHAGKELTGLVNSPLPFIRKDHDIYSAIHCVITKDSSHPLRLEPESLIIHTPLAAQLMNMEVQKFGIKLKDLALGFNIDEGSLHDYLTKPKHWFDANDAMRRSYYLMFLWINLPKEERAVTFEPSKADDSTEDENLTCPVENVPPLHLLTEAVLKELRNHNLNFGDFVQRVAKYPDPSVLRNLLLAPLPWKFLSPRLRRSYANIWFWMKKPTVERLKIFNIQYNEDNNNDIVVIIDSEDTTDSAPTDVSYHQAGQIIDTAEIIQRVLNRLTEERTNLESFSNKIMNLPTSLVKSLFHNPVPWHSAKNFQKFVYLLMNKYLGQPADFNSVVIDTREVARDVQRFLREHGISNTDFATKVVKIQRPILTNLLNSPIPWSGLTEQQQRAVVAMSFWRDLSKEDKLAPFYSRPPTPTSKAVRVHPSNPDRERLQAIAKESKEALFSAQGKKISEVSDLDTASVAERFHALCSTGAINLKCFAAVLGVGGTFLAGQLEQPVAWKSASKLQKYIFLTACNYMTDMNTSKRKMSEPRVASAKKHRFSKEQLECLQDALAENPRPSSTETRQIAELLELSPQIVKSFFNSQNSNCETESQHFAES